jgi:hypothetical protein
MMNKLAVGGMSTGTIIMRTFHGLLAAFFLVTALMLSRRENRRVTSRQQWPLAKEVFRNATFSVLELTT